MIKKSIFEHIMILNHISDFEIDIMLDNGLTTDDAQILGDASTSLELRQTLINKYLGGK